MSYQLCTKGILLKVENASKSAPTEHSMPKVIVQQTRGASPMEDSDVTEQDVKKKKSQNIEDGVTLLYFSSIRLFYLSSLLRTAL